MLTFGKPKLSCAIPLALTLLLYAVSPAAVAPVLAQASIKILVNDAPITSFDIKNRTAMLKAFTRGRDGEKQAIEQLVDEKLMLQEAERRNVKVSEEEVAQEFAKRATQARLSPAQFEAAMRQTGIDPETFKNFLRSNMAWREIVRARFRSTVNVTEQDVAAALSERQAEGANQAVSEYMLQQIIFIVPPGAGKGVESARQTEANAFRSRFQGCDSAIEQASGRPGVVVKPTVRRAESEIGGDIREAIMSLEVGGVTTPQRVGEGFQIVALCDKRAIAGQSQATDVIRQELSSERGELMARRYLRDLRSDAVIEYR